MLCSTTLKLKRGEDEFNDPVAMAFRVKWVIDGYHHRLSRLLLSKPVSGRKEEKQATGELSFGRLLSSCLSQRVALRATGRASSCSSEDQYAPRSPDSRTNDENTASSGQLLG